MLAPFSAVRLTVWMVLNTPESTLAVGVRNVLTVSSLRTSVLVYFRCFFVLDKGNGYVKKVMSELGGNDEAIVVIGREAGSGTRGAFEELLGIEDSCAYAQELDSTGAVLAKVGVTAGAIGYVSLDVVDDSVIAMSLNGVAATEENIIAGNYLLSRPFFMATMGEVANQNELVQLWFDYINSELAILRTSERDLCPDDK